MFQKEIERALKTTDPIEALRQFVLDLNQKGYDKGGIYDILYTYSLKLAEEEREVDSEILEDVMDMVTGWFVGRNLDLRD